jgi:cysteine sulfinate desulfinase/cysteine desulfurase-like protein
MTANNETGVLQPMAELARLCDERGVLLHRDMVHSFGKVETNLEESGCAAASFAAHKFYGPKGAGLLYLRAGVPIEALQFGGAHEISGGLGRRTWPLSSGWRRRNLFCAIGHRNRNAKNCCASVCGNT